MSSPEQGGSLAAETLRRLGVEVVYALPGGHVDPLLRSLGPAGVELVVTRHEEGAVLMAGGHALATGRPAVACVTAGPGLANAVGGIAEVHASGLPVVVIAGRTGLVQRGRGAVQDLDQAALVAPVTKWRATCFETARIPEYVEAALHHASTGSPGVAYLEIPDDVLKGAAELSLSPLGPGHRLPSRPVPDATTLGGMVDLLAGAERPVVLAGSGAFFSGAGPALEGFAERTGIPVVTTSAARGLIPDGHPCCVGGLVHGGAVTLSADVVLLLGSRFNANLLYGRPPLFAPDGRVIQVDLDPEHLGGQRVPAMAVVGDVAATLEALRTAWELPSDRFDGWRADALGAAAASRDQWAAEASRPAAGIHPGRLAEATARFAAARRAPFVVDGGNSVLWGLAFAEAWAPGSHLFIGSAMGTLGVGLPFSIAAAGAWDRPAVLFTGDGAFGLSAIEVDTAARSGRGLMVVVVNNGGWSDDLPASDEAGPSARSTMRYDLLATAVGGHGERIETFDRAPEALERAWTAAEEGRCAVIDAVCDPKVVSELMVGMGSLGVM